MRTFRIEAATTAVYIQGADRETCEQKFLSLVGDRVPSAYTMQEVPEAPEGEITL